MGAVSLNLSRKWRSQNFDQIIGQDLAVRILKNSLYLGHYFPVYLFAGQRGCGKTTTARVFAAALNCEMLSNFQKNPKKLCVPCLNCTSCIAMREGNHPDFIEIDAASHTGVDNIRNIIENSSLLPLMGCKKVYLIDEAHMLSKAAFNAALKILEEPPATALFILATTNPHKIIDTVRSRCFQLFFTAIADESLISLLLDICKKEKIAYDEAGLTLIAKNTEGSARDALNLLEQVRFSGAIVNKDTVLSLLGHVGDNQLLDILDKIIMGSSSELIRLFSTLSIERYNVEYVWQRLMELLRTLIWIKHDIDLSNNCSFDYTQCVVLAEKCSLHNIIDIMHELYNQEALLLKTNRQHIFLETILVTLCLKNKKKTNNDEQKALIDGKSAEESESKNNYLNNEVSNKKISIKSNEQLWIDYVHHMKTINDPIVQSLFQQAQFIRHEEGKIIIECAKELILFKDRLEETRSSWQPILQKFFDAKVTLDVYFSKNTIKSNISKKNNDHESFVSQPLMPELTQKKEKLNETVTTAQQKEHVDHRYKQKTKCVVSKNELAIDVSNKNVWKISSMLLHHFPGIITEVCEN